MKWKIALYLYRLIPTAFLALWQNVIAKLTGNPHFPTPLIPLATMTTKGNELEAAIIAATDGNSVARTHRDNLVAEMKVMLQQQADYVRGICKGDKEMLESSGFTLAKKPSPIEVPAVPQNAYARTGDMAGSVEFRWNHSHGAHTYEMQLGIADPTTKAITWSTLGITTRSRNVVPSLESHKLYYFRVVAVGVNGASLPSAITQAVAA